MQKWLEPAIDLRIAEVIDSCEDEANELYDELQTLLLRLNMMVPETSEITAKIENIFNLKTNIITQKAYRIGFDDGLYIGKQLR